MMKSYVSPSSEALKLNALCVFAASDNAIEAFLDPEDFGVQDELNP